MKHQKSFTNQLEKGVVLAVALACLVTTSVAQNDVAMHYDHTHAYLTSYAQAMDTQPTSAQLNDTYANLPTDHLDMNTDLTRNAMYPGGHYQCHRFLAKNFVYPEFDRDQGTQGVVKISFHVLEDGSRTEPVIVQSVSPTIDKEAIRVVSEMPNWEPALYHGEPTRSKVVLPISIKLH